MRSWEKDQIDYFNENYGKIPAREMALYMGKSEQCIIQYAHRHGVSANRYYTKEEVAFIEDNFGTLTTKQIASKLHRPLSSVKGKISRLGLGTYTDNSVDLHLRELARLLGVEHWKVSYWIEHNNLPYKRKGRYVIFPEDSLMQWLKDNPDKWDATKCETWYFERLPWFHEKLLNDRKERYDRYA